MEKSPRLEIISTSGSSVKGFKVLGCKLICQSSLSAWTAFLLSQCEAAAGPQVGHRSDLVMQNVPYLLKQVGRQAAPLLPVVLAASAAASAAAAVLWPRSDCLLCKRQQDRWKYASDMAGVSATYIQAASSLCG